MPQAKSKSSAGLGNALMNDRFGKGKGADRKKVTAVVRTNHATGEQYMTNDKREASWVRMRSVTEQGALDEFLATAELAGTDFTAEKSSGVKIIRTDQKKNTYLLSTAEEEAILGRHHANRARLTVPRRPRWDESTTAEHLDELERESFLNWRRGLARLQEEDDGQDLLMTPFERNLEVWRQLWRVVERSDLVVQIVDGRNPLLFRCADLESYVAEVDPNKRNLLLINKADMMTVEQRRAWAQYLNGAGIAHKFFSASLAAAEQQLGEAEEREEGEGEGEEGQEDQDEEDGDEDADEDEDEDEDEDKNEDEDEDKGDGEKGEAGEEAVGGGETKRKIEQELQQEQEGAEGAEGAADAADAGQEDDPEVRILTVDELESIFLQHAPQGADSSSDRKIQVGLVGYPNVGKSSTINALIGAKKVSVSATPGKTKHFQTIHLSDRVVLCDCPGLVFPNFATTKAELVCNGVLPIDQLREHTGPAGLVALRIPRPFLEAMYGIQIRLRPAEEGGTGVPSATELLFAYAAARGFSTQGVGRPDEARAARHVLKDYVSGRLPWCAPPPGDPLGPAEFNRGLYDEAHLPESRRAAMAASVAAGDNGPGARTVSTKSKRLDEKFFAELGGNGGHLRMPFSLRAPHGHHSRRLAQGGGTEAAEAAEDGLRPVPSKKHFKGGPRFKKAQARGKQGGLAGEPDEHL